MAICTTGKWIDKKTGAVVDSEPQEGRLLVAPGSELSPSLQDQVRRAEARAPLEVTEVKPLVADEKASEDGEPETAALSSAPESSAVTGRTGKPRR